MTTFEEAKLCPKCGQPGAEVNVTSVEGSHGRPVKVFTIRCMTVLCKWYQTHYLVQVNEDGTIPEAHAQNLFKQFPKASPEVVSNIENNYLRQLEEETRPGGGEVRNPNG